MFAIYGIIGLTLVILSYIFSYVFASPSFHHLNFPFELGYWLFFDAIDNYLSKNSLLERIKKKKIYLFYLILAGAFVGLFLDFFAILFSKVWEWYPVINNFWKTIELYVDWGLVLLMIYSSYRVFLFITKKFGKVGKRLISKRREKKIFHFIGITGFLFLTFPFVLHLLKIPIYTSIISFTFVILGFWFICEFVEYQRRERSLLKDIFEGYWNPIIAIVAGSALMGLVWETMNVQLKAWVYTNIPLSNVIVLGTPLLIILGWPALFIVYLSFYRALFKGRDIIWR